VSRIRRHCTAFLSTGFVRSLLPAHGTNGNASEKNQPNFEEPRLPSLRRADQVPSRPCSRCVGHPAFIDSGNPDIGVKRFCDQKHSCRGRDDHRWSPPGPPHRSVQARLRIRLLPWWVAAKRASEWGCIMRGCGTRSGTSKNASFTSSMRLLIFLYFQNQRLQSGQELLQPALQ
jgi:hypothetical protein